MKLNKTFLMALMIILLWGPPLFAQQTADEIMRAYYNLPIPDTQITTITMVLREKDGTKVTRIMEAYLRETEDGTDNFMEFISPADVKGTRFLTLGNNEGSDDQRLWLPALQKTRKIASSDKGNSFMGSDLSYYDMESRFFSEATYEMAGEETIVVIMDGEEKQTDCWIIESTYIDPEAPYLKSLNWVSKENNFVYKSKIWDKNGKEEKDIYILETKVINNMIIKLKILVVNVDGHKTLMLLGDPQVNVPIDPLVFTIQHLER